jgi:Chaperone of endosialidase
MARNGSGVYSLPPGTIITNGTTSNVSQLNTPLQDIEADLNAARPIVAGGTGAASAASARQNLAVPGTADAATIVGAWTFSNTVTFDGPSIVVEGNIQLTGQLLVSDFALLENVNPQTNNAYSLGSPALRWANIYLVNSPNVSSDARLKTEIRDLHLAERRAAARIRTRTFLMDGKRKVGYIAQEIVDALAAEDLDAFEYGLVMDGDYLSVDYDAVNAFRLG